ncbi:sodium:calcium antiporter [Patescibacteria group bacterium]
MLFLYLVLLIFFSFLLIKSTEILIQALNRLSRISRIGKFALTTSLMALATSLPELFVGITAALENQSSLALGNVLGSNIANISLVIGGAALVGGSIGVAGTFLKKDIFYAFLAGAFPLVLLIDGKLTRVEGLLLLLVYGIYNYTVLLERRRKKYSTGELAQKIIKRLNHKGTEKQIAWVFLGAALLVFSADSVVKIAGLIAHSFKVPLFLVGLFLVAIGTSLPELSFEIGAIRKKQVGMVFGDLLGSITANSTLILGVVALINPVFLDGGLKPYLWATLAYFLIFMLFWLFIRTKKKLERWEGLVLLLVYIAFVIFEFWRASSPSI